MTCRSKNDYEVDIHILFIKNVILILFFSIGQIEVTNDGATILRNIGVDNPAAKVLVNISKIQDDEVSKKLFECYLFESLFIF